MKNKMIITKYINFIQVGVQKAASIVLNFYLSQDIFFNYYVKKSVIDNILMLDFWYL